MDNRKYEAFYILDPSLTDPAVQKIAGQVASAAKWDKRKLAYPIAGHTEGNYVLMDFECGSQVPKELSRLMRISDDVIRHRIYSKES